MRIQRVVIVLAVAVAIVGIVQLFFRYQYIPETRSAFGVSRTDIVRIDRLTGATCVVPCSPTLPTVASSPTPLHRRLGSPADAAPAFISLAPYCGDEYIVRSERHFIFSDAYKKRERLASPHGIVWDTAENAVEVSDGHVFSVSPSDFNDSWAEGDSVTVCSDKSRVDGKTYYSLEINGSRFPAAIDI